MSFWDPRHFDFEDELNRVIWAESPALQRSIQSPHELRETGKIGAQQAMLSSPEDVLPWVPDLVGRHWREQESLLIVGSAYAGFIREYSKRPQTMPFEKYKGATTVKEPVKEFQPLFLKWVVERCSDYYGRIACLASGVGNASRIALFDLCRVSFVERGQDYPCGRNDKSGDGIVEKAAAVYEAYVEGDRPRDWLWQRIVGSWATCLVALGRIAEHGLLRLFAARGMQISPNTNCDRPWTPRQLSQGKWVNGLRRPTLLHWLKSRSWWNISGDVEGVVRTWRLLPVYHPSRSNQYDLQYARTSSLLDQMVGSAKSAPRWRGTPVDLLCRAVATRTTAVTSTGEAGDRHQSAAHYPLLQHAHLVQRIPEAELRKKCVLWTGNDRTRRNHNGMVSLNKDPLHLRLCWKSAPGEPECLVGCYVLHLHALLSGGYVRYERKKGDRIRLRFYHAEDDVVYIQTHGRGLSLLVGTVSLAASSSSTG